MGKQAILMNQVKNKVTLRSLKLKARRAKASIQTIKDMCDYLGVDQPSVAKGKNEPSCCSAYVVKAMFKLMLDNECLHPLPKGFKELPNWRKALYIERLAILTNVQLFCID